VAHKWWSRELLCPIYIVWDLVHKLVMCGSLALWLATRSSKTFFILVTDAIVLLINI